MQPPRVHGGSFLQVQVQTLRLTDTVINAALARSSFLKRSLWRLLGTCLIGLKLTCIDRRLPRLFLHQGISLSITAKGPSEDN